MSWNTVFITVGVGIILVLMTALIGPFFVDWTVYRSTFENYAERALGHKVSVLGEADLRLLPTPVVTFSDVRVGEAEDPLLVISRFQMRVELPPLLKGEVRVLDMELERPHLAVSIDEQGKLDWLNKTSSGGLLSDLPNEDIAFEKVSISDGALSVVDARNGKTYRMDDANLLVSARSLAGPYKVDGTILYDRSPYTVRMATGQVQDDGTVRVKADIIPSEVRLSLNVDGVLSQQDARPLYKGEFSSSSLAIEGASELPWTVKGNFAAGLDWLDVLEFKYQYGPDDRNVLLTGKADIAFRGENRFTLDAQAKRIDLDRFYGRSPQEPDNIPATLKALGKTLSSFSPPDMFGEMSVRIPTLVVAGGLAQDVRLDIERNARGWHVDRFAAELPGHSQVATAGDFSLDKGFTYRGDISVKSRQPASLLSWWHGKTGRPVAMHPVALEGRLNIVPDGMALDSMRLGFAGETQGEGGLSYRWPENKTPVFSLSLDANKLDLDQLTAFANVLKGQGRQIGKTDVSLRVRARTVQIADAEGRDLALEADYSDSRLNIDRLYAEDLAGARFDISGRIDNLLGAAEGELAGQLAMSDADALLFVLDSAFPHNELVGSFKEVADTLVPARFDASLKAAAQAQKSRVALKLEGVAGGVNTLLEGDFTGRMDDWASVDVDARLEMSGADGVQLLRQAGFSVLPVEELGPGHVSVTASGQPAQGLAMKLDASLGTAAAKVEGRVQFNPQHRANYDLQISGTVPDVAPFALLGGHLLPVTAGEVPVDLAGKLSGEGAAFEIRDLSGQVAGVPFKGQLEGRWTPETGETLRRIKGVLDLGALDLLTLSESILGPDQWSGLNSGGGQWPDQALGTPLLSSSDIALSLTAGKMMFADRVLLKNVQTGVRLTPDMVELDSLSGLYGNGNLSGALALRRTGGEGLLSGQLQLEKASLSSLAWQKNGRAVASGDLDIAMDFEGSGRSISSIVSSLSGGGTFSISEGALHGVNTQAFDLVIRAADAGLELNDKKIRDVFLSYLDAGNLQFERLEGILSLVGGQLNARNVTVNSKAAKIFGSAEADLTEWQMTSDMSLTVDPGEEAVTGADLQVGVLFDGPLDAPRRSVDISPLTAFLTLRAFEREVDRVERLQADILERERLLRLLKIQKQERARRERKAAEEAARLAAEQAEREATEKQLQEPDTTALPTTAAPAPANDNASVPPARTESRKKRPTGELLPLEAPQQVPAVPSPSRVVRDPVPETRQPLQPEEAKKKAPKYRMLPSGLLIEVPED